MDSRERQRIFEKAQKSAEKDDCDNKASGSNVEQSAKAIYVFARAVLVGAAQGVAHGLAGIVQENSRVEEQGVARGARQGQQGSSGMILQAKDTQILSLLATSATGLASWINMKSDNEKIKLLNQLRKEKIEHESRRRCHTSKLESIYYIYLEKFFAELQALRINLEKPELQDNLKKVCTSELKPTANFTILKKIDFFPKPKESYARAIQLIREKKYHDALKQCDDAMDPFKKMNGEYSIEMGRCYSTKASCFRELKLFDECFLACEKAISIFNSIASDKKAAELIAHTINKYQDSLTKSRLKFSDLYSGAVALFKNKNYHAASARLIYLIEKFSELLPTQKGNCYSALAACYRELGEQKKEIEAYENAITFFKSSKLKEEERTALIEPMKAALAGIKSNLDVQLYMAAETGRTDNVKKLLAVGANPNFYITSQNGFPEIVKILIMAGANPNLKLSNINASPIHVAAWRGFSEIVKILLEAGADPNSEYGTHRTTPIYLAAQHGKREIVNLLLHHKQTDITLAYVRTSDLLRQFAKEKNVEEAMNIFLKKKNILTNQEVSVTPAEIAEIMGHTEIANIINNAVDAKNNKALKFACLEGDVETVKRLLLNIRVVSVECLDWAIHENQENVVKVLLEDGRVEHAFSEYLFNNHLRNSALITHRLFGSSINAENSVIRKRIMEFSVALLSKDEANNSKRKSDAHYKSFITI